jgi:hypothetical protein
MAAGTFELYLDKARQAEAKAARTSTEGSRLGWLEIAQFYRRMAEQNLRTPPFRQ